MAPSNVVYLGDDVDVHFLAWDNEKGKPIDISGAALFCVAQTGDDSAVAASRFFIDDGPKGVCRARFSGAQTSAFKVLATYSYDGRVRVPDGAGTLLRTIGAGTFRTQKAKTPTP